MDFEALAQKAKARKTAPAEVDFTALARKAKAAKADMSLWGRIKDNVVGVDDGVNSFGENLATALNIGGESLTLGVVGDEAAAAADAAMGRGSYAERLTARRDQEQQFRDENPTAALVAEVAPAFVPGAGMARGAAMLSTRVGRAGAGAALGTAAGGTYGFMEGEGGVEDRTTNAAISAALGGAFGAAAPKVLDGLTGVPKRVVNLFRHADRRPSVETLQAAKNAAYGAVDQSGFRFSADDMQGLSQRVRSAFDADNYVPETDDASRAVLRVLEQREGQPVTISQLDRIRRNFWDRYSRAGDQPRILEAISEIDALIESKAGASELMAAARGANARYAKSKLLEDAFEKARLQTASTGSGGNLVNKYRQAVASIVNNPKKAKFFTGEEIDLMKQFIEGTKSENFKRLVGKMSPSGNGLMQVIQTFGAIASSGATIPAAIAGNMAKGSAERQAMQGAETIQDVVSGFRPAPQAPQITRGQAALITGAASGGANASSEVRRRQSLSRAAYR